MRTIKSLITNQRSDGLLGLARLEGLEPPTGCLEGSCSIRLSYRRRVLQFFPAKVTCWQRCG